LKSFYNRSCPGLQVWAKINLRRSGRNFFLKMTLQEKLARETGKDIYLYKQGVFWVAYEQSALLSILEKNLKPSVRFICVPSASVREIIISG